MKKILRNFFVVMIGICYLWNMAFTAYAEEKEATLFQLNEPRDVTVAITYEVDDVTFTLVSPSGQMITRDTDEENITVFSGTTATIVFLGQAEPGEWKIRYDKGSNESISVSADVQDTSFFITEYQVGALVDDKIPISFAVSTNSELYYNYKVILTTNNQSLNGKELASGRGKTGEIVSKEIGFDTVNTYDTYYLLLYVYYDLNGSEIFDYAYSEAFAYTNADAPGAMENVDIVINHDTRLIDLNWKNYILTGTDSVFVAAYAEEESILSCEYPKEDGYTAQIPFEAGDSIILEISYKNRDGEVSEVLRKEIQTSEEMLILPLTGKVSSDIWNFEYKGAQNTEVEFRVNDEKYTLVLDGEGSKYLTLPETRNDIYITYQDEEGYIHEYYRAANISNILPTIDLLRSVDGVTTEKSMIMISGTTNAELLTINGVEVEVTDGTFTYQYDLAEGQNDIEMEAAIGDNVAKLSAMVTRKVPETVKTWIYLCAGLVVSLIGILLVAILTWRRSRRKEKGEKYKGSVAGIVINWLLAVLAWAAWIALYLYTSSAAYLELAYESLKKANYLLVINRGIMWVAVGLTVLVLLRTLLHIVLKKIRKKKEEGVDEKPERARKKLFKKNSDDKNAADN